MDKRVVVLGCGPAGLFSAWAAINMGYQVEIFSKKRPSELFGAQYLHKPIPGIESDKTTVAYDLLGTAAEYQGRVYGFDVDVEVSPSVLNAEHDAWDIRSAYKKLYGYFFDKDLITDVRDIEYRALRMALDDKDWGRGVVINSIPLPSICGKGCRFEYQTIKAIGDAPERGVFCPVEAKHNTVLCNGLKGNKAPSWYRVSNVFGYNTAEYPESVRLPGNQIGTPAPALVKKPIRNYCRCNPEIYRVGRYGSWTKGVLSHDAFFDTVEILNDYERRG